MKQPIDILIVEDNYALRESLADYLQSEGFNLRCVDDGEELNAELAKRVCDVLVLDLNLPNEDGISIAKRIRSAFPKMGIVILTARVQGVDRTQSYESGADIYLTKLYHRLSSILFWSISVSALIALKSFKHGALTLGHFVS
jgi:DNA-binding response OmpR family regulator